MLHVGSASTVINNDIGTQVQGASVAQIAEYIRDNLEANLIYFKSDTHAALIISCDVAALETQWHRTYRNAIAAATGLGFDDIIITATHTHAGPSVIPTSYFKVPDVAWLDRLTTWLVDAAKHAIETAVPAKLRIAQGELALGHNRRHCWADDAHSMQKRHDQSTFTGVEGPTDPTHTALLAEDEKGQPIAVLHANSAHPTMFYGAKYYSSEYPGEARAIIRHVFGDIPVLYINGPFGDISPTPLQNSPELGSEQHVKVMGARVAGLTLHLLDTTPAQEVSVLESRVEKLDIPIRLPDAKLVEEGRALLARVDKGENIAAWDVLWAHGRTLAHDRFHDTPSESLAVHTLRIGDLALVTHPTELYCQFGIDIRRRSNAPMTVIADVSNGFSGYCPTYPGYLGGGYSGDALYWTRLAPEAGYRIVDAAARMLTELFSD